jgi:hypothetical protein
LAVLSNRDQDHGMLRVAAVRLGGCTVTALLCAAAYWTLRLAYADHLAGSKVPEDIARATRLAPANSRYWLLWADGLELAGEHSGDAVERAVSANPQEAAVWIQAGLRAEMDGNYRRAEHDLLEAARLSRQYAPRWTLANFYFRRDDPEKFWRWTHSAGEWAYGDRTPLFQLAWAASQDASTILERAIPDTAPSLSAYLGFLIETNRLEAAEGVAARLAPVATGESRSVLLTYINRQIDSQRPAPGLNAWNTLCARGLLPYPALDASHGRLLTNGDFAQPPLGSGFDWRVPQIEGVASVRSGSPAYVRLAFSGKQPEDCRPLSQLLSVTPGAAYKLRFEYQTEGIPVEAGPRWRIYDATGHTELPGHSPLLASDDWRTEAASFTAGTDTRWVWVTLGYQRMPGTTRIEGSLTLRNISLEEADR